MLEILTKLGELLLECSSSRRIIDGCDRAYLRKQSGNVTTAQRLTQPILSDQASLHRQKEASSAESEQEAVRSL